MHLILIIPPYAHGLTKIRRNIVAVALQHVAMTISTWFTADKITSPGGTMPGIMFTPVDTVTSIYPTLVCNPKSNMAWPRIHGMHQTN